MAKAATKKMPKTHNRKSCDCVKQVNEQLKPFNTELELGHAINFGTGELSTLLYVATRKRETKPRAAAKKVVCAYCPFCGKKF